MISTIFVAALTAATPQADPIQARMAALYDEICLRTFPDDAAVDALMKAKGAKPMTPEEVKVTLNEDPGRGWLVPDGDRTIEVTVEMPPYPACVVRRMTPSGFSDLGPYQAVAEPFRQSHPGFGPAGHFDRDVGDLHIHATGDIRPLPGGRSETLYIFDQRITDAARRASGETGVQVRFVHQIVEADAR
jgi:hypothetical protein